MTPKNLEQRSAEALVATFVQMSRSAELARWLQQMRQRSLESRVRRTSDARELVKLQVRLDAQQSQAAVLEAATNRFRGQAPNLAQFTKAGLTMEDFHRLGVRHVIAPEKLAMEIEKVKRAANAPAPAPTSARPSPGKHRPARSAAESETAPGAKPAAPADPTPGQRPRAHHAPTHPGAKRAPRKRAHRAKDKDKDKDKDPGS